MKRFVGIAAIAFAAQSGWALAQPVIVAPPDEAPRGRAERLSPGDSGPQRVPGRVERDVQQPPSAQRGPQSEGMRAQESQRGEIQRSPNSQREQAQRERHEQQTEQRAQEMQRGQSQQREREQAQRERHEQPADQRAQEIQKGQSQRDREQAQREERAGRPDNQPPGQQRAQPQQPGNQPGATESARPGATPGTDDNQRSGSAQRPGAQPGTADSRTTAGRQPAGDDRAESEKQTIAESVRSRIDRNEIKAENLGVSVSVGAQLPARVQLQPVPSEIASLRPQYRNFRYTVSDREIVIVDPGSRRVVEVIERDGGRHGGIDVYASFERRRDVRRWRAPTSVVVEQGVVLPADAPYADLPVEIVDRNPRWRGYQYVMTEQDEVAIVEPRSHRIVDVVDKSGTRSAAAAPTTSGSTARQSSSNGTDSRHEIARLILNDARPGDIQGIEGLKGAVLSSEIVLRPIPTQASEQDSELRGYHYALVGDDVLIVDPQSRRIVDVIE